MEIFIYFLVYAISWSLAYIILFKAYDKKFINRQTTYVRHKRPLWFFIAIIGVSFIPIVNILVLIVIYWVTSQDSSYTYRSIFNKEF